ncbi:sugar ABC transporter ATP-binding protein [Streptomyces sp. CA-106131]|uniref:sugar ABC transporter ATP-binding protein n=1 Tax=Streptomyces sp. CA-106131 TaxID=3240045 RepID=UPI003D8F6A67
MGPSDTSIDFAANGSEAPLRLKVRGLSKHFGSVQALDSVDFELRGGEIMALLGENGAGKSTLVKTLAGLVDPDAGSIEVDGVPVSLFPSSRSQAAGVAVVHQEYCSVPTMTVAENLVLGQNQAPRLWNPRELNRRARTLLAGVGLDHLDPRTRVEQLSVAEMQLLEIARLLVRDARILIFDEPTAALTDREIERVLAVIRRLAAEGRSIVYVTHRLDEVFRLTDRVTVFRNGRSQPAIDTRDIDVDGVIKLMLGRDLLTMFPARGDTGNTTVLEVDGLRAPGLVSPVSFRVRAGEIVGLAGQLGSGASVVIQTLAGRLPRTAGRVVLEGQAIRAGQAAALRAGISYCSSDRKSDGIFGGRSIRENLSSPWLRRVSTRKWISSRRERQQAIEIADRFAIDAKRLGTQVGTLSGGNQQKVAVGKWLGSNPKVMLVEEPTRGVDIGARAEIYQSLRDLCSAGLAIVVVSSDTAEVIGFCDTIATFYRGSLTSIRPHTEWTEAELTREVMHTSVEAAS